MVGPGTSEAERDEAGLRLKVGFVLLVGASGGLVALQADGSMVQLGVAVVAGVLLGLALATFLQRLAGQFYRTN